MTESDNKPEKRQSESVVLPNKTRVTWGEIGESFEAMGKIGLALAVGMSAAGLFCKLADQGKVRIPSISDLVLPRNDSNRPQRKEPS